MNFLLAQLVLNLFLSTVSAASAIGYESVDVQLKEKNILMGAICEGIARAQLPYEVPNEENPVQPYFVDSMTVKAANENHLVYLVTMGRTVDGRLSIEKSLEYHCFRCVDRLYEQVVLTSENDPINACEQESL